MRLLPLPEHQPGRRDDENKGSGRSGPTKKNQSHMGDASKKSQNSTLDTTGLQQRKRELNNQSAFYKQPVKYQAREEKALFCLGLLYSIAHTKGKVALSSETDRSTGCVKDVKTSEIMSGNGNTLGFEVC